MSKSKRAKSGSAHDSSRWDAGLAQAILNDEIWKTCVFFLAPNKLEDNALIDTSCEVISTGLRKLFSVITKETLFKQVKEFAKANTAGGGKGKQAVKLPEFVEVCELVKPFIDQGEDIPPAHLAKLLKFKLLHLKTLDFERREEAKKLKSKDSAVKKTEKRANSPNKGSKSPKRKGKKGEAEPPPSPKKDTKMKKRGEVDDTFKTIDDEPDDPGSPHHYILIHGFTVSSTLQHLANIGVHVNAIINIKQNEYKDNTMSDNKGESMADVEEDKVEDEFGVDQEDETDEIVTRQKEEARLAKFWTESDELVIKAPSGHKLKDIGKYEVVIPNQLDEESFSNDEKKSELGTEIFEKIANVCYDMLDHQKNYHDYLDAMKLLHVPLHTPSRFHELSESQPTAPPVGTDPVKDSIIPVEIDMRYYNHLASSVPGESMGVPIILHCLLEQVVASVDETNPMDNQLPLRGDGLDHQLAAHINSKMADLALSTDEKEILVEKDNEKNRRENVPIPQLLDYNDNLSQRLCYLEDLSVLDGLAIELAILDIARPRVLNKFPHRTEAEFVETKARFHQLTQHCALGNVDEVSHVLKNYTFEGMPLKSVDNNGYIIEPYEVDKIFSSYKNPWDDPYSDLTNYFNSRKNNSQTMLSAAVDLVSFRNLDEWCYIEHFDKNTLAQVFDTARYTNPYVDTYYHQQDDTLLVVFHNPLGRQLHSHSIWHVRLHSNVGFRNYLEHVRNRISDWTREQELLEEENNRVPTPVVPTPEPPQVQIKAGSRYGLKTRAEIAALKAEEEDKGKKKGGKRSARPRSKSGKKSQASKQGSAKDRKGSTHKNRATSGTNGRGNKASKIRVGQEMEPEVKDDEIEEEKHDFLGYDVGDDLIHVTGVQTSMFPCDGGQIHVEKTTFVHKPSTVSAAVYKDGNILKLHFLEAVEELVQQDDQTKVEIKEDDENKMVEQQQSDEGLEKSEFEKNEKHNDSQHDISLKETKPAFCKHASFVASLNDGMIISTSGFGSEGSPPVPQEHSRPVENSASDQQQPTTVDSSPPPKVTSAKSRKKNEEEAKRLEEERRRAAEEEEEQARRAKEQEQKTPKSLFHEVFVTCPDGLHVSYQNDDSYPSVMNGGVIVRQRYPVTSRGLHDCEAVRWKVVTEEKSRCTRTDGTVIKMMVDDSVQVLYPDGMTSTCPVFPNKLAESLETSNHVVNRKAPTNTLGKDDDDVPVDQDENVVVLQAEWTTVTSDGERFVQNLDGSKTNLEPVKLSVATCPVTDQIYKTREDNVITVIRPNGTQIVEHSDGTRITTFYQRVETEIIATDQETGEEAKYESQLCRHVKVECEGFATVVMETVHGWAETLFGNGNKIKTLPNGSCVLRKSDGSQLHFDIKGNVIYVPCGLPSNDHDVNLATMVDSSKEFSGVYILRTTSQHCCEMTDEQGNVFSAFTNGEIKVTQGADDSVADSKTVKDQCRPAEQDVVDKVKDVTALSSPRITSHVPRYFVLNRDGSGYELLREQDVNDYLEAAENHPTTAVLRTPVEGHPELKGITVLKPFTGGIGKTWLLGKDEQNLIPEGLRERDFKLFPRTEFKKIGPKFGTTAGQGLNIGDIKKTQKITPQLTCPKVLVLRHLIQYKPLNITQRQTMSAAFQKYGQYVMECQQQLDNLLPHEPRGEDEIENAKELAKKYEPAKYTITNNNNNSAKVYIDEYIRSVTPVEEPAPSPPVWKRPPGEWERDRIELAKLEYGKHALRYHEVPPYFETSQGQEFLTQLKNQPDMKKLTTDLDKQACPVNPRTISELSGTSTATDNETSVNQANRNNSKSVDRSSAVLENLEDNDGRNSLSEQPVQSSTPLTSRPINPTPAQAAGRPTPTTTRPTNPTPAKASNVIGYVSSADSPRVNQQDMVVSTPLEALMETRNEGSFEEERGYRVDNDTALDLNSSTDSQLEEEKRVKSLFVDVTGSLRKDPVKIPKAILGAKPGALPNTQFSTVEEPVRRKVQTVSVASRNVSTSRMRGFQLHPAEVDFGVLKEGCTYIHSVTMKNIGIDIARFKVRQPPPSTGMKVLFTPGPVAAGMSTQLDIEIFAVAVGVSGETGIGSIGHHVEIVSQTDIFYLPVTAIILTCFEYDNRSPTAPRGGPSQSTRMIANRPPSRDAIRPQRDYHYSNVAQQF